MSLDAVVLLKLETKKLVGKVASLSFDPQQEFEQLQDEDLADTWPQIKGADVDIIIGQDYCWKIMA